MAEVFDSIAVKIAFATADPWATASFTTITSYVRSGRIRRGRDSEQDQYRAATCELVLDNTDRRFEPSNTAGPYYSGGATQVVPSRRVQVQITGSDAKTYDLFSGHVDRRGGWTFDYDNPNGATATIRATDMFALLGAVALPDMSADAAFIAATDGELTNARITRVLDEVGVNATWRDLDTGFVRMQPTSWESRPNALTYLQDIADAEGGAVYISQDGQFVFDHRHAPWTVTRMNTSQNTFGDTGADLRYHEIEFAYFDEIYNHARVTPVDMTTEEYSDATSIAEYGDLVWERDNLEIRDAPEANAIGEHAVKMYKSPLFAPSAITIHGRRSTALADAAIQRELRDRITVKYTPPGTGTPSQLSYACMIESIEHAFAPNIWSTRFGLSAASRYDYTDDANWLTLDTDTWRDSATYHTFAP